MCVQHCGEELVYRRLRNTTVISLRANQAKALSVDIKGDGEFQMFCSSLFYALPRSLLVFLPLSPSLTDDSSLSSSAEGQSASEELKCAASGSFTTVIFLFYLIKVIMNNLPCGYWCRNIAILYI